MEKEFIPIMEALELFVEKAAKYLPKYYLPKIPGSLKKENRFVMQLFLYENKKGNLNFYEERLDYKKCKVFNYKSKGKRTGEFYKSGINDYVDVIFKSRGDINIMTCCTLFGAGDNIRDSIFIKVEELLKLVPSTREVRKP